MNSANPFSTSANRTVRHSPDRHALLRRRLSLAPAFVLALALAACAAPVPNQPDFASGMWDGESITPPPGMLTAYQGELIGRRVDNTAGATPLTIVATIVEPNQARPRYVVLQGPNASSYVVIAPINALVVTPSTIQITATDYTLRTLPNYPSMQAVQAQYPRTVITAVVPPAPSPSMASLPPVLPPPVTGSPTAGGPLQFARMGSVVGLPVVDQAGTPVGQVTAVAVVPTTGEVRYAIVSGPSFGPGYYIAVPAGQAIDSSGEVVLSGTLQQWQQAPRYRGDQLPPAIGAIGGL